MKPTPCIITESGAKDVRDPDICLNTLEAILYNIETFGLPGSAALVDLYNSICIREAIILKKYCT